MIWLGTERSSVNYQAFRSVGNLQTISPYPSPEPLLTCIPRVGINDRLRSEMTLNGIREGATDTYRSERGIRVTAGLGLIPIC